MTRQETDFARWINELERGQEDDKRALALAYRLVHAALTIGAKAAKPDGTWTELSEFGAEFVCKQANGAGLLLTPDQGLEVLTHLQLLVLENSIRALPMLVSCDMWSLAHFISHVVTDMEVNTTKH